MNIQAARERQREMFERGLHPELNVLTYPVDSSYYRDLETIRDHDLAGHPADDLNPVTEQWWFEEFGRRCIEVVEGRLALCLQHCDVVELHADGSYISLRHIKTRGQVRRLIEALRGNDE